MHFLYRGDAQDVGISGRLVGDGNEGLERLPGTDLFHYSARLDPGTRWEYRFIKDLDENITELNVAGNGGFGLGQRSSMSIDDGALLTAKSFGMGAGPLGASAERPGSRRRPRTVRPGPSPLGHRASPESVS